MSKKLLILEQSTSQVTPLKMQDNSIILEGIFTQFNVRNRNNRIYVKEDFLPMVENLGSKIRAHCLLGELDHPESPEVSLQNASHVVESLRFDSDKNAIIGRIKLLNTQRGKDAQALVEAGVPLHISSRAAGQVDAHGVVQLQELFTYDLVAEPGFEQAELKVINESYQHLINEKQESKKYMVNKKYGITDNSIELYECDCPDSTCDNNYTAPVTSEPPKLKVVDELTAQIATLTAAVNQLTNDLSTEKEKSSTIQTQLTDLINQASNIKASVDGATVKEPSTEVVPLASEPVALVTDDVITNESLKATIENIKSYLGYLKENIDKTNKNVNNHEKYLDYITENVNNHEKYMDYVTESVNKQEKQLDCVAKNVNNHEKYLDYVAENICKHENFLDYVSENINDQKEYLDYVAENMNNHEKYMDYIVENVNNHEKYMDYISENVNKNSDKYEDYLDYIAENVNNHEKYLDYVSENINNHEKYLDYVSESINRNQKNVNALIEESVNSDNSANSVDSLTKRIDQIVAEHKAKEEEEKAKLIAEAQIKKQKLEDEYGKYSNLIAYIPEGLKISWANLSDERKKEILKESEMYELNTIVQVNEFWNTRNMKRTPKEVNQIELPVTKLNESKTKKTEEDSRNDMIEMIKSRMRGY